MLIEALIVNGHLGSSSDGRILECGSRSTQFTIDASIKIKVHYRLNHDYGSWPAFYASAIIIWAKKTWPLNDQCFLASKFTTC